MSVYSEKLKIGILLEDDKIHKAIKLDDILECIKYLIHISVFLIQAQLLDKSSFNICSYFSLLYFYFINLIFDI